KRCTNQQQQTRYWRLIEQQLHAAHLPLAMVTPNPHGIHRAGCYAGKGKYDTSDGGHLGGVALGKSVVVRDGSNAKADGNERQCSTLRNGNAVKEKVDGS